MPNGSGSSSYWGGSGSPAESKYQYQKASHGQFNELGFTQYAPQGGVGPFAQYESERIVASRNQELMQKALNTISGAQRGALGLMESYRPGGAASIASGIQMQGAAQMANIYSASRTEAPDLLYQHRRDTARRARKAGKKQAMLAGVGGMMSMAGAALTMTGVGAAVGIPLMMAGGAVSGFGGGAAGQQQMAQTTQAVMMAGAAGAGAPAGQAAGAGAPQVDVPLAAGGATAAPSPTGQGFAPQPAAAPQATTGPGAVDGGAYQPQAATGGAPGGAPEGVPGAGGPEGGGAMQGMAMMNQMAGMMQPVQSMTSTTGQTMSGLGLSNPSDTSDASMLQQYHGGGGDIGQLAMLNEMYEPMIKEASSIYEAQNYWLNQKLQGGAA